MKRRRFVRLALIALALIVVGLLLAARTPNGAAAVNVIEYRVRAWWWSLTGQPSYDPTRSGSFSGVIRTADGQPLAGAVAQGDPTWADTVRWVVNGLIQAEESGVTSANVQEMMGSDDPTIKQFGFAQGPFGSAEVMSKAFDTSVDGMARDGTLVSRAGRVSLTPITGYTGDWAAAADSRRTVWEATHYMASALGTSGEESAARLYSSLDRSLTTPARDLGYRLYTICEQKGWSQEGTFYNGLVVSWPEITRLADEYASSQTQGELGL